MTRSKATTRYHRSPFLDLLGVRARVDDQGNTILSVEVRPELTNSYQATHGGGSLYFCEAEARDETGQIVAS